MGWKITHTFESQGEFFAYVAPFVDARAIQDRFDEVFGIDKWQVSYEKWGENATKCTISVFLNERWISKEDGSEESDYSSVKGGFSNSLMRDSLFLSKKIEMTHPKVLGKYSIRIIITKIIFVKYLTVYNFPTIHVQNLP